MGITRSQIARQLLAQGGLSLEDAKTMAPQGEFLAYINPKEAQMLKDAGGSGIMTPMGIPSFVDFGGAGSGYGSAQDTFDSAAGRGGSRTGAGGGPGPSRSDTGTTTDDVYAESSKTNRTIAKANRSLGQKIVDSIKGISKFSPLGLVTRGLGSLFSKFGTFAQNMRGFNPDGTPRTQAQFERARDIRRAEKSISNIMGRDAPFTDLTLDRLADLYSVLGQNVPGNINESLIGTTNITRSTTPDDVYPDRAEGIVSQARGNPNVKSMMGEYFNVPIENRIGSTFGINPNNIDLAGLNQKQVDYLNKIDQMNKKVGNTGLSTTNKSLRFPDQQAGAFFEYKSPQEVLDTVMGLNEASTGLFSDKVDPDKNVYGDINTFAQPDEITNYIQSLSPQDRTYSFGIPKNEPGKNYLELFKGGFIK